MTDNGFICCQKNHRFLFFDTSVCFFRCADTLYLHLIILTPKRQNCNTTWITRIFFENSATNCYMWFDESFFFWEAFWRSGVPVYHTDTKKLFNLIWKWIKIIIVYTTLSEKIMDYWRPYRETSSYFVFFQKESTYTEKHKSMLSHCQSNPH